MKRLAYDSGARSYRYLEEPAQGEARGTLVMLHAFPLSARMWAPQEVLAADGWRIIAPQFRQFDGGGTEPEADTLDAYARDTLVLLDALEVGSAVFCGASMGGYVTFAIHRLAPERLRGVILADTRADADTPVVRSGRERLLNVIKARGAAGVADDMLPKLLGGTTKMRQPKLSAQVRSLIMDSPASAMSGAIHGMLGRPDSTPQLSSLGGPALVIVGAEDALTTPEIVTAMRTAIPGSDMSVISGAGHLPNLEQPSAFNDAVRQFLRARL